MTRCLTFCIVFLAWAGTLHAAERSEENVFQVDPGARLSLESHKGFIKIRTAAVSAIEVRVKIITEEDPALLEYVQVEYRDTPSGLDIKVHHDQDAYRRQAGGFVWKGVTWPMVEFDILMPDDGSLRLETHKSEIDVEAPAGEVRIESHKGTGTITGIRSDLDLETHKGNFQVVIEDLYDLKIQTHKGDVTVDILRSSGFTLEGFTHKGRINFPDRNIQTRSKRDDGREKSYYFREGNGAGNIELDTHKGNIEIRFDG